MHNNRAIYIDCYDQHDWDELFKRDPWRENISEEDWNLLSDDREEQRAEMRCD